MTSATGFVRAAHPLSGLAVSCRLCVSGPAVQQECTALHYAATDGNLRIVRILLAAKAKVDALNRVSAGFQRAVRGVPRHSTDAWL